MVIFPLSRPLVIRHPGRASPSGPPTRNAIVWAGRTHAITVCTSVIPGIARRFVTSRCPVGWGGSQPSLSSRYRILREALGRRHD